jgi:hypothetical protein
MKKVDHMVLSADERKFLIYVRTLNKAQKSVLGDFMSSRSNGVFGGHGNEATLAGRLRAAAHVPDRPEHSGCKVVDIFTREEKRAVIAPSTEGAT